MARDAASESVETSLGSPVRSSVPRPYRGSGTVVADDGVVVDPGSRSEGVSYRPPISRQSPSRSPR